MLHLQPIAVLHSALTETKLCAASWITAAFNFTTKIIDIFNKKLLIGLDDN